MKRAFIIVSVLLLIVIIGAFAGSSDTVDGGHTDSIEKTVSVPTLDEQKTADRYFLQSKGYSLYTTDNVLSFMQDAVGAKEGDVLSVTSATKGDSSVNIYYFKDATTAKNCFESKSLNDPPFHLLNNKIIMDNSQEALFEHGGFDDDVPVAYYVPDPSFIGLRYTFNKRDKTATVERYDYDEESVVVPEKIMNYTVTAIKDSVFYGKSLKSAVLPATVKEIGKGAFRECANLESLSLPDGVTTIGPNCFKDCTALTRVVIPKSVTHLGAGAFFGCDSLSEVLFGGTKEQWDTLVQAGIFDPEKPSPTVTFGYDAAR